MSTYPQDVPSSPPPRAEPPTLTLGTFLRRLLRGAARGLGVGIVLLVAAYMVGGALQAVNLLSDEGWETWMWSVYIFGGIAAVYVLPIVGVLVEIVLMIRRASGH